LVVGGHGVSMRVDLGHHRHPARVAERASRHAGNRKRNPFIWVSLRVSLIEFDVP